MGAFDIPGTFRDSGWTATLLEKHGFTQEAEAIRTCEKVGGGAVCDYILSEDDVVQIWKAVQQNRSTGASTYLGAAGAVSALPKIDHPISPTQPQQPSWPFRVIDTPQSPLSRLNDPNPNPTSRPSLRLVPNAPEPSPVGWLTATAGEAFLVAVALYYTYTETKAAFSYAEFQEGLIDQGFIILPDINRLHVQDCHTGASNKVTVNISSADHMDRLIQLWLFAGYDLIEAIQEASAGNIPDFVPSDNADQAVSSFPSIRPESEGLRMSYPSVTDTAERWKYAQEEVLISSYPDQIRQSIRALLKQAEGGNIEVGFFAVELDDGRIIISDLVTSHDYDQISEADLTQRLDQFLVDIQKDLGHIVRFQFYHTHPDEIMALTISRRDVDYALKLKVDLIAKIPTDTPIDIHALPYSLYTGMYIQEFPPWSGKQPEIMRYNPLLLRATIR